MRERTTVGERDVEAEAQTVSETIKAQRRKRHKTSDVGEM
jgi:hypothetical protein